MPADNVVIKGSFTANENTKYAVEHYLEGLDGGYTLDDTEELSGTTGTEVTARPKSYPGFIYTPSVEGTISSGTITGDGKLTLKLYYTRNSYKVTYGYENSVPGASELPGEAEYKYGATVEVAANATAPGYTFSGWKSEGISIEEGKFTMPADNVVIKGSFTANTDTKYTVEYYYQQYDGSYSESPKYKVERQGTTDTEVFVTTADKTPEAGFVYDENAANVENGIVAGDGSLVLKLYFYRATFNYEVVEHYIDANGDDVDQVETPGTAKFEEAILELSGVIVTQNKEHEGNNYYLIKVDGYDKLVSEDEAQNKVHIYYALDNVGGKDPENPNIPDEVPDMYQTTVVFASVNGTVDGETQVEKVVTMTDADGNWSADGSYTLKEEDIPEAVAATGYSQESKTWDAEPEGAEIRAEGTKNTFTVTFSPADQTYIVQYIDEDTNEGLKEQDVFEAKYGDYINGADHAIDFEGYTFTRATELWVTEDNQINYVFVYYSKDVIGKDDPNTPDGVPDKYQTFVVFAAVNGTVNGETQVEKVVTLTDADGNWSADGSYTLKEEDIPEAVAAVGYDQATATWDSENPASPVGSVIDNGEDTKVTFTVTFSPADQTYIVQYIDEDTNEGLKEQDVFEAKYGDYINGADHAIEFEGYTFTRATELWVTEDNQINYVFVYYSKDEVGPEGPDDVPDKYQLVFTYVSADPATGTVTGKTVEVKTFKDEAGNYTEVKPTSPNTMDGHNPVPTAADGYAFAYWTEEGKDERDYTFNMTYTLGQKEYTENTTFVAHFLKDEGGKEDPNQPDGKPDEYQIKFTYVTEDPAHGTFAGVNEVSEILDRPTNIDGSPNMEAGVSPTVSVTITENGRYRFDHWTDAAGTEYTTEELRNATFTADATFTAHFRYISSSGGNGGGSGSSGGTGPYTPSTGGPGAAIIGDNDVPLAPLPTENNGGNVVIFDDSVPLAPLPKTGQQSSKAPVTMLLTGIFLMFASLKRRKEEKQ